jgi:uncharacterized protein (TIGR02246 family)
MNKHAADTAAIRKLAMDWNSGWDSGNAEALVALYADDCVLMPQGQPPVIGKHAIRSLYQSLFQDYVVKGQGQVMEAVASGDLGYLWISYSLTATSRAGGDPAVERGKSVFIVKRQNDNSWRISRLIDNSDREA